MEQKFKELINLVHETRQAQNNYFKVRTQSNLSKAKQLEHKLDKFVELYYQEPSKPTQTNLF